MRARGGSRARRAAAGCWVVLVANQFHLICLILLLGVKVYLVLFLRVEDSSALGAGLALLFVEKKSWIQRTVRWRLFVLKNSTNQEST